MTDAIPTQGVVVARGNGASPEVFNAIAEIRSFDGPGGSASVIDASSLDSTAREKLMGLPDEGQFSFEANLVKGDTNGQDALRADRAARVARNFKVTLPDGSPETEITFTAYVLEFRITGGVDEVITAAITLEITGAVSYS